MRGKYSDPYSTLVLNGSIKKHNNQERNALYSDSKEVIDRIDILRCLYELCEVEVSNWEVDHCLEFSFSVSFGVKVEAL